MSLVTVNVTEECIRDGKPGEPCMCPVFNAIFPLLTPEAGLLAEVGTYGLCWSTAGLSEPPAGITELPENIPLPDTAREFISEYDAEGIGDPFSFVIDIPDELLREEFRTPAGSQS